MANLQIASLSISGYAGNTVPNRFFRQEGDSRTLAVLFPGLWYTCDMPLLFYPLKLLLQRGAEVLQVRADYTTPAYQHLPADERAAWLATDAHAAVQAGLAQRPYAHLVLVGKSIGTAALAGLLTEHYDQPVLTIWLTPLLQRSAVVEIALRSKWPALFVVGSGDDLYDADAMARIRQSAHAETLLIEGADHSLEVEGNLPRSLEILAQVMEVMGNFLSRYLPQQ